MKLYITRNTQEETTDVINENGQCEFYASNPEDVADYLQIIGADEIAPLEWERPNNRNVKL